MAKEINIMLVSAINKYGDKFIFSWEDFEQAVSKKRKLIKLYTSKGTVKMSKPFGKGEECWMHIDNIDLQKSLKDALPISMWGEGEEETWQFPSEE